ncbi:MAG: response regulator [candidate division Zixibacteria bacterium]|nr:response regulator [candidate division Zixibacteria bacterium]
MSNIKPNTEQQKVSEKTKCRKQIPAIFAEMKRISGQYPRILCVDSEERPALCRELEASGLDLEIVLLNGTDYHKRLSADSKRDDLLVFEIYGQDLCLEFERTGSKSDNQLLNGLNLQIRELTNILAGHKNDRLNLLTTIDNLNRLICGTVDLREIFKGLVKELKNVVPYDRVSLVSFRPEIESFCLEAEYERESDNFDFKKQIIRTDQSSIARNHIEPEAQIYSLSKGNLGHGIITQQLARKGYKTFVTCPIIEMGQPLASLNIGSLADNVYTENDLQKLKQICALVGRALVSIRSFQELRALSHSFSFFRKNVWRLEKSRNFVEIARGIMHAINNHLALIMGRSQILMHTLDKVSDDPKLKKSIELILRATTSSSEQIAMLQSFSRMREDTEIEHIRLKDFLESIFNLCLPRWEAIGRGHVEFAYEVDESITFSGSKGMLREAFINLIMNAVEAQTEDGGAVKISAKNSYDLVEIKIEDSGDGISKIDSESFFVPFRTTKEFGSGLGLYVAREIINHHNGRLDFKNSKSGGLILTISLPLEKMKIEQEQSAVIKIENVMILDSNCIHRNLLADICRKLGFNVKGFKEAQQVTAKLNSFAPDLVIVDQDSVEGLPLDFCERLYSENPGLRICLMGPAMDRPDYHIDRIDCVHAYLGKPLEENQVAEMIKALQVNPSHKYVSADTLPAEQSSS